MTVGARKFSPVLALMLAGFLAALELNYLRSRTEDK